MYIDLVRQNTTFSLDLPDTVVPVPETIDYESGFIDRYFTQKVNDSNGFVFEIDLEGYTDLSNNPYWSVEKMRWRITGPINGVYSEKGMLTDIGVRASNIASISISSSKIKNIDLYLINPLQFYK